MVNSNSKKYGNPYGIDYRKLRTKEITDSCGIPINEAHRWSDPFKADELWILEKWARWYRRRGVPHVVVDVPAVGQVVYKHLCKGGYSSTVTKIKSEPEFCCGADK